MLEIKGLDTCYGDVQALWDVSLEVHEGSIVALVGANGSGKSTLLKTISGMLRPRRGTISLDGNDISQAPSSRIVEQGISHVPEGRQIFPTMTVLENLEMGAQFPRTKKVQLETLQQVFGYFPRLRERLNQKAGTLSGGEQQRVAIARALARIPLIGKDFILLCDEPTGNLDTETGDKIIELIREMNVKEEITCLIVTHNQQIAEKFATKIIRIINGMIER